MAVVDDGWPQEQSGKLPHARLWMRKLHFRACSLRLTSDTWPKWKTRVISVY